jgi:uncharacterized protein YaaN involved in tellurite resistance
MPAMVDTPMTTATPTVPSAVPAAGIAPVLLDFSDPAVRDAVAAKMAEVDLADSNSIMLFGTRAQQDVTSISDEILEGVRSKDIGPAGEALSEMLATLRGFNPKELAGDGSSGGLLGRLFGAAKPVSRLLQRYEEVRGQIDAIGSRLDSHTGELMRDIALLDRLYQQTLAYFHQLAIYIGAGEALLDRLDRSVIPEREREAAAGDMAKAQALRDLRTARDDLERRVHDLKLTRQVAMQSLPSIRLIQENDKSLVNKITSVLANTVPLWRQQLAQAVTIHRSREASRTLKEATDLTNELLLANAETLKQANQEARSQIERGVFDIEAVKNANALLIATLEDSLRLTDEAKRQRVTAAAELQQCERQLRDVLLAARAKAAAEPARR